MPKRYFVLPGLFVLFAACASEPVAPSGPVAPGKGWIGRLVAYQKVVHEAHGIVGYVKVYEYRQAAYADSFRLNHIVDLDFRERGVLNETGTGTKYVYLPADVARVKGLVFEEEPLDAQPFAYNVARILGVSEAVKILPASAEDVRRAAPAAAEPVPAPQPEPVPAEQPEPAPAEQPEPAPGEPEDMPG